MLMGIMKALCGAILETSFTRFHVSMTAFNAGMVTPLPLGKVNTRDPCEGTVM